MAYIDTARKVIAKANEDPCPLVLPLRGVINIEVGSFSGKVSPGECVVVQVGQMHHFDADTQARFVVADLHELPVWGRGLYLMSVIATHGGTFVFGLHKYQCCTVYGIGSDVFRLSLF
jgi:hypothetical protein